MRSSKRSLILGVAGAGLLCAGAALAQETNTIGPPQLRDFQLRPREQAGPQPTGPQDPQNPQPQVRQPPRAAPVAPPPPVTSSQPSAQPTPAQPQPTTSTPAGTPRGAPTQPGPTQTAPTPTPIAPPPTGQQPPATGPVATPPAIEPEPATPSDATPPTPEGGGAPVWLYGLPVLLLVLGGMFFWRRRRARSVELAYAADVALAEPVSLPEPVPAAPRPDPSPRPWLELDVRTIRASFTPTEAVIEFELTIANIGGAAARNLKIDVKMFNAGAEQDQQIGTFFRTAGRETTRLVLPGIEKEQDGVIRGEVGMPLDEMKAVKLDGRMLFIPVLAVNVLYEWGEGRSGQSAKSYVVGRELETPSEKMGAFRVDQGPRVWRTVGQRQHKLARRV
ncbi:hypothetical protein [Sphingosinicella sp.]|uniref:hypothetical protein n=1 Tax=Sphingosinicella sp. TaxID=1917971 RepID=UPI004038347A